MKELKKYMSCILLKYPWGKLLFRALISFLKRNDVYDEFILELKHSPSSTYKAGTHHRLLIKGAFPFKTTRRGAEFWNDINKKWDSECDRFDVQYRGIYLKTLFIPDKGIWVMEDLVTTDPVLLRRDNREQ